MNWSELIEQWKARGGEFLPYQQSEGVCHALCQQWVTLRLGGHRGAQLLHALTVGARHVHLYRQRELAKAEDNRIIPGLDLESKTAGGLIGLLYRGGGPSLMKVPLLAPGQRGAHIFGGEILGGGGGHALGIDTTWPDLYIFDPNGGQFWMHGVGQAQDDFFINWLTEYWFVLLADDSSYGARFFLGARKLWRYTLRDPGAVRV